MMGVIGFIYRKHAGEPRESGGPSRKSRIDKSPRRAPEPTRTLHRTAGLTISRGRYPRVSSTADMTRCGVMMAWCSTPNWGQGASNPATRTMGASRS